jgi:hypothetical protein
MAALFRKNAVERLMEGGIFKKKEHLQNSPISLNGAISGRAMVEVGSNDGKK